MVVWWELWAESMAAKGVVVGVSGIASASVVGARAARRRKRILNFGLVGSELRKMSEYFCDWLDVQGNCNSAIRLETVNVNF